MSSDHLYDTLEQFGLSGKEIDTYLAIVEHGEAKTSDIAEAAGVSRSHVYNIAEELEERGLVEVNDHLAPTTISAKAPEEVSEMLTDDVTTLEKGLRQRFSSTSDRERQFRMMKVRDTILNNIRTLISEADREIQLSIPFRDLPEVRDELEDAVDREVLVILLLGEPGVSNASVDFDFSGVANAVRVWEYELPVMMASDQEQGVLGPTETLSTTRNEAQALSFRELQLAPVMVGWYLANYWSGSEEIYVADPLPLPQEFGAFRPATFHAFLHLQEGISLKATIRGQWVDDGRPDTVLEGEVIDVEQNLVNPTSEGIAVKHSISLSTENGRVRVGGGGSFIEDFEAEAVRLEEQD